MTVSWVERTVDAIPYLTLPSLTESCTTMPGPTGAFAMLALGDTIAWTLDGKDPFTTASTLPERSGAG